MQPSFPLTTADSLQDMVGVRWHNPVTAGCPKKSLFGWLGQEHFTDSLQTSNQHSQNTYNCLWPFSGTTRVSRCQKKSSSGLYGAREDNRGRHTHNLAGRHSIRTNQWPTSTSTQCLCRMPFLPQPSQFIWLGRGTKYAGLHTQWLGSTESKHWREIKALTTTQKFAHYTHLFLIHQLPWGWTPHPVSQHSNVNS